MAGALAYPVRAPQWVLVYTGTNITADISRMILSITYTDHLGGAASDIEVELEDRNRKFQGPWMPVQGDLVNLQLGYQGEALLPCGDFQVDELEAKGPPDTFHLRCISAYITQAMRTPNSAGYENQTLMQIASTIAAKYDKTVIGAPDTINVTFNRRTQKQETDVAFLHRLAEQHAYDFKVEGTQFVFFARTVLEAQAPVLTIARTDVTRFSFKNKTHRVYKAAQVQWQDAQSKGLITQTVQADPAVPTGDTLNITERCQNAQDAMQQARAALHETNSLMVTGSLTLPGEPVHLSGNTVTISGFGAYDGKYIIKDARHRLERGQGYSTEIDIRSVAS